MATELQVTCIFLRLNPYSMKPYVTKFELFFYCSCILTLTFCTVHIHVKKTSVLDSKIQNGTYLCAQPSVMA